MELHIPEPSVSRAVFAKANLVVPAESIPELSAHLQWRVRILPPHMCLRFSYLQGVASISAEKEVGNSECSCGSLLPRSLSHLIGASESLTKPWALQSP